MQTSSPSPLITSLNNVLNTGIPGIETTPWSSVKIEDGSATPTQIKPLELNVNEMTFEIHTPTKNTFSPIPLPVPQLPEKMTLDDIIQDGPVLEEVVEYINTNNISTPLVNILNTRDYSNDLQKITSTL